jgi:hypothetical protein
MEELKKVTEILNQHSQCPDRYSNLFLHKHKSGILPIELTCSAEVMTSFIICQQEALGRTNNLLSFDRTRTASKTTPPTILLYCDDVFIELLPSNDTGDRHRDCDTHMHPTIPVLLRVFFAATWCFPSRCLAMKVGIHI